MRNRAGAIAVGVACAVVLGPSSAVSTAVSRASDDAPGTCFGRSPTIVGASGEELVGTEGPDVVVTNGALSASTLAGDDLLCVTGVAPDAEPEEKTCWFETGSGDDRVDASVGILPARPCYTGSVIISPGLGRDEVLAARPASAAGNVLRVTVFAHEGTTHGHEAVADADVITTGDESDLIRAGLQDIVHVGEGNDHVEVTHEGASAGGVLDGGAGWNSVDLTLSTPFLGPNQHFRWRIDNQSGELTRDGRVVARMSGFSDFDVHARGPLRFIGTERPETFDSSPGLRQVEPAHAKRRRWPLLVEMRGGNDIAVYYRGGSRSRFDGGDGTDRFVFAAGARPDFPNIDPDKVLLDLSAGKLRYNRVDGREVGTRVPDFEGVRWWSRADATIIGTSGPNTIVARTREAGTDMIVYGKRGDDNLRGGAGEDILIGGQGRDVADGRGGMDRCIAEVRTRCES